MKAVSRATFAAVVVSFHVSLSFAQDPAPVWNWPLEHTSVVALTDRQPGRVCTAGSVQRLTDTDADQRSREVDVVGQRRLQPD